MTIVVKKIRQPNPANVLLGLLLWLWLLLGLMFIVFSEFIAAVTSINILKSADDLILVTTVAIYFLYDLYRHKTSKLSLILLSSVIAFFTISIEAPYFKGIPLSVLASLLYCKIFIFFLIASRINQRQLDTCIKLVLVVHLIGFGLNLIAPSIFVHYLPDVTYDLDVSRIVGFELNPNRFAAISCVLAFYFYIQNKKLLIPLILFGSLILSGSRSFVITFFVVGYYIYSLANNRKLFSFRLFLLAVALATTAIFFADRSLADIGKVEATVAGDQKYIRAAMLYSGATLALKYFPFGTGGGTFGSPLSLGSKVYSEVGIASWPSVITGSGIHDSGIGSLLGEYGVIGLIILTYFLYRLFSLRSLYLTSKDIYFLLLLTFFLSFFRGVVSSYFYALFIFIVTRIIGNIRLKMLRLNSSVSRME